MPPEMLSMIAAIYKVRKFIVRDGATTSSQKIQQAGIAQGCPLSPYLFVIVMSVLLEAVDKKISL